MRSHQQEAQRAADEAGRYAAAAIAESRLATRLSPITAHGYYILADRQWPGSKDAQLDVIVVGPSGVWIIDSKHWKDFEVAAGHLFRGQDEAVAVTDADTPKGPERHGGRPRQSTFATKREYDAALIAHVRAQESRGDVAVLCDTTW